MFPDPAFRALASLKGLDEDFPPRRALIHSEPTTREFSNLVSHFHFLPSLDGLIIADPSGSVNRFFEKKLKKFF